jgi:hypothetical protein
VSERLIEVHVQLNFQVRPIGARGVRMGEPVAGVIANDDLPLALINPFKLDGETLDVFTLPPEANSRENPFTQFMFILDFAHDNDLPEVEL